MLEAVAIDAEHLQLLRGLGFRSSMIVPLNAGGRTLGDLALVTAESGRSFTEDDLMMAMELAARCALAVDNARLYRDTQEALRARDEFLAIASHELKTPLTGLLGYVELIERRGSRLASGDERDSRALARIRQQAERLQRLIADVLDLSRIQLGVFAVERRRMDLAQMVRDVVEEIRPTLQRHQFELATNPANVPIEGDRRALEQVLQNLVSNAVKYSPDGGPIVVQVRRESDSAVVLVSDPGIGIPTEEQARLFQRFYRAANVKTQQISGFGIGLYLAHEIVTRHDGTIKVTSEEGHGTTFTIALPLASEPTRAETR